MPNMYLNKPKFEWALKRRGISQRKLAKKMELSQPGMNYKVTGKRQFTQDEIARMKVILGLTAIETVSIFLTEQKFDEKEEEKNG